MWNQITYTASQTLMIEWISNLISHYFACDYFIHGGMTVNPRSLTVYLIESNATWGKTEKDIY